MLYRITPDLYLDPENVAGIRYINRSDYHSERHVMILLKRDTRVWEECPPEYTIEEIAAAINGGCYYRKQWTDECGDIDVCVVHNEISDSEETWDPLRYCRKRDPKYLIRTISVDEGWVGNDDPKPEPPDDMKAHSYEPKLGPVARFLAGGGKA